MRLHQLDITAFGPFAGTATVDFDELSEASLFLLCGDTGAGKTTVLDAICFALYGDVPSDRAVAKQLRSHHAADGVAPRVMLTADIAGRRLRFTRSPAWQRPKKRGSGTTTEQAHVLIEEQIGGEWVLRTNRLDEAGHLVTGVLGMTLTQFSQVVLLPQNQFDTFLRASSEDRQKVLTQLFRTSRFEQVEQWFARRRRELHREHARHRSDVAGVLHRISETAGVALPDQWEEDSLTEAVDCGSVTTWVDRVRADASEAEQDCAARERRLREKRDRSRARLVAAEEGARLRSRHETALARKDELDRSAEQAAADREALERARRAEVAAPFVCLAEDAEALLSRVHADAARSAEAAWQARETAPLEGRPEDLPGLQREVADALAAARALLPPARALDRSGESVRDHRQRLELAASGLRRLDEETATLPDREADLLKSLEETRRLVILHGPRKSALATTRERIAAADSLRSLHAERARVQEQHLAARERVNGLKETLLDLRELRLHGMAAELASAMVVGQCCPVCGSAEHPAPAQPAADAPGRAEEDEARAELDDAELGLAAQTDKLHGLDTRIGAAAGLVGDVSEAALAAELDEATRAVDESERAVEMLPGLEEDLADLRARRDGLEAERRSVEEDQAIAAAAITELNTRIEELRAELAPVLPEGHEGPSTEPVEARISELERLAALVATATEDAAALTRQQDAAKTARERAGQESRRQGFTDPAGVRAHALDEQRRTELARSLQARERSSDEVEQILADPDVLAAVAEEDPVDPGAAAAAVREADSALDDAVGAATASRTRLDRLTERSTELHSALAGWEPVRREHSLVSALAELVEGKGHQNSRQMRLSAYVLSARLGQVVAAANERLSGMADSRYLLEHTDQRGAGDRRGGLGLRIRDQWTDECRDPVTLSGGETFVVSLALALGLADVVTAEAGGSGIDTLFVDEGFGSLDPDTLESVLDTLDQLREGGRVVGLVSHVSEMRDRIPARLEVVKGRHGSTIRVPEPAL